MHELAGTLIGRWYVTAFGAVFCWRAGKHLGWRRTLLYALVAVAVGGLAENGSVHLGVPYTRYAFNPALRGKELWLGDVPLMVPLSYTFMSYFAFASARLLVAGPWRTRVRRPLVEYALGVVLAVWAVWILDPVARLGQRFYLGRLFHYAGPGFWFGLPLGSQLGFTLTAGLLVGLLAWLARAEPERPAAGLRRHPHAVALLTYHAQVAHLAIVALVLGATELGSVAFIVWLPAALMTAVYWDSLRPSPAGADVAATTVGLGAAVAPGHPPRTGLLPVAGRPLERSEDPINQDARNADNVAMGDDPGTGPESGPSRRGLGSRLRRRRGDTASPTPAPTLRALLDETEDADPQARAQAWMNQLREHDTANRITNSAVGNDF